MTDRKIVNFGIIGCGLMGKEFASAVARWHHLIDAKSQKALPFAPRIVAVCDVAPALLTWFSENIPGVKTFTNHKEFLQHEGLEAVYCAVPHNLHAELYIDIINAGKHLLGEKPFGIDLAANQLINEALKAHPEVFVRCSSEFPFYPGAYLISKLLKEQKFGRIIEVEAGFWHSSDLNPEKAINWKRLVKFNGDYGCLGDLGMHVCHIPFRFGLAPKNVRALLTKIVAQRPSGKNDGVMVDCETWDNATLACEGVNAADGTTFPLVLSTKRISPGDTNTWFINIKGTKLSAEFSTKNPKTIRTLPYTPGQADQAWHVVDLGYSSAYSTITGGIFEFGFPDSILQMWAAFIDELVNVHLPKRANPDANVNMLQYFKCATPEEVELSHKLFTAALQSHKTSQVVSL